jgi:hypothetical protein
MQRMISTVMLLMTNRLMIHPIHQVRQVRQTIHRMNQVKNLLVVVIDVDVKDIIQMIVMHQPILKAIS